MKNYSTPILAIGLILSGVSHLSLANDLHAQSIKESLDYQELKDHTDRLAMVYKELQYQVDVITTKDNK